MYGILFQCEWTRHENGLKFLWGSEGFEAKETPRAEFVGHFVVNQETKKEDYVYNDDGELFGSRIPKARQIKFAVSALMQLLSMLVTISWCVPQHPQVVIRFMPAISVTVVQHILGAKSPSV